MSERIVRRGLAPEARAALAHLLNNALCVVAMEASMLPRNNECDLRLAIKNLRRVVAQILEDQDE